MANTWVLHSLIDPQVIEHIGSGTLVPPHNLYETETPFPNYHMADR